MIRQLIHLLLFVLIFINGQSVYSQQNHIPLSPHLEANSKQELIKIGMINKKRPPKVRFGTYYTENRYGASDGKNTTQAIELNADQKGKLSFAFDLVNDKGDSTRVEALEQLTKTGEVAETSIYFSTNIEQDDLWILMCSPATNANELSLSQFIFTNGEEEIEFELVTGDPTNKSDITAPKGIEAFYEGNSIGAMQFYSGGSFSYKKYIWISEVYDAQIKMILAAAFSAIMEVGAYFEDITVVE